jgi:uncharacterized membrane protein
MDDLYRGDALYDLVYWVHLLTVIVGFGSTFVWPFLAVKSREVGDVRLSYYIGQMSLQGGKILSSSFIYAVGVTGILLVVLAGPIGFADTWISIALTIYIVALGVSLGLHLPNLRAMNDLQRQMAEGSGKADNASLGAELAERGKKAGMYGGILHLLFALLLLDMVFQPGTRYFS